MCRLEPGDKVNLPPAPGYLHGSGHLHQTSMGVWKAYRLIVALLATTQNDLSHDTIAKHNENENTLSLVKICPSTVAELESIPRTRRKAPSGSVGFATILDLVLTARLPPEGLCGLLAVHARHRQAVHLP